jgi:hypothetical protein
MSNQLSQTYETILLTFFVWEEDAQMMEVIITSTKIVQRPNLWWCAANTQGTFTLKSSSLVHIFNHSMPN